MLILLTAFVLTSADVLGQDKWMVTPSRGGAEGARAQAQLTTIQNESMRMNACTVIGRIYAPTHPNRDANNCIPHLNLNPSTGAATFTNGVTINSGGATVTGNSSFNNDVTVGGATTVNNTLSVTGTSTFGNNMTVNGRVTANQLFVGTGNVGSIPTCTSAQKLQWNGTAWSCVTDNIGATAATEIDPKVGSLINGRWCRSDGLQIVCDQAAPSASLNCRNVSGPIAIGGSYAACASDEYVMTGGGVCETPGSSICAGVSLGFLHHSAPSGNGWWSDCHRAGSGDACGYSVAICCKR